MDIKHYYQERGSGEVLILLHGNGENGEYFVHQMEELSKEYRVIAIDTRGHGKTPRGSAPFTIRQFAEDLHDFMDEHGIERAHILGFSDGANTAVIFAGKYPERVGRLILNGGNLTSGGVKAGTQLPIEAGYRIARHFAAKSRKAKANAEMLGLMVNDPDLTLSELAAIKAETLVLAGTRDMIKKKETRRIAEGIAHSKLVFIKGTHFIANKNPEVFNAVVGNFLKGNGKK